MTSGSMDISQFNRADSNIKSISSFNDFRSINLVTNRLDLSTVSTIRNEVPKVSVHLSLNLEVPFGLK